MTGVTVGHADDLLSLPAQIRQMFSFFHRKAQRFLTYHMETGFKRCASDRKVRVVGCGDRDSLDTIIAFCF